MTAQVVVSVDKWSVKMAQQELARLTSPEGIKFTANLAELRRQLGIVNGQIRASQKSGDLTAEVQFRTNAESLKKQITIANRELVNFTRTGSTETSALGQLFGDLGNRIWGPQLWASLSKLWAQFSWFFVWALAGFAALRFAMDWFKQALDLWSAINRVGTVTGATTKQLKELKSQVIDLSTASWLAAQWLAETAFNLWSAWVAMKDIPQLLEQISLFSVASGADTNNAFKGINAVIQGYGLTLKDVTAISDLFFVANAQGTLTIEGLASEIQTVVPIANAAGVEIKELFAAFATLVWVTGNESEVATQLKWSIQALIAPGTQAADTMKSLGIEWWVAAIQAKGFWGLIQEITEKAQWNPEVIKKIIPEVRALTAVLALWGDSADKYAENLIWMWDAAWATQKALADFSNTDEFRVQKDLRRYENFKIQLGWVWVSLVAQFSEFVSWMSSMAKGIYYAIAETIANLIALLIVNFWNIVKLADNLVSNMWWAFASLGWLVLQGLWSALKPIESFFNSVLSGYNSFVKKIWAGFLSIEWKINIGADSLIGWWKWMRWSRKSIMDGVDFTNTFTGKNYSNTSWAFNQGSIADKIASDAILTEKRKKTLKELADFENALDQTTKDTASKSWKKAANEEKKLEKEKQQLRKDWLTKAKQILKEEVAAQKEAIAETEKWIKKLQDAIEKFDDIAKKISSITWDKNSDVASRYNDITKDIESAREKLSDFTEEQKQFAMNIWESSLSGMSKNAEFQVWWGGISVGDLREILKLQKELNKLEQEKELAKKNTTDEAIQGDQKSETQKILDKAAADIAEQEALKLKLETELGIKAENAAKELEALTIQKADQQLVIDAYTEVIKNAEAEITEVTKENTAERITMYDAEMQKLRQLIALRQSAGVWRWTAWVWNTTTNNTTIAPVTTVNAKINSNMDLNVVADTLSKKITLSSKWIN